MYIESNRLKPLEKIPTEYVITLNWDLNKSDLELISPISVLTYLCCCWSVISCVQLFVTPWTVAHQAFLSFAISWSLLKLMSLESMMPALCSLCTHDFFNRMRKPNLSAFLGPEVWAVLNIQLPSWRVMDIFKTVDSD